MKKFALTVAVLTLGLAGCGENTGAETNATNDLAVENAAANDMNLGMENVSAENMAENALENASNSIENAQEAVSNMAENTTNAQ